MSKYLVGTREQVEAAAAKDAEGRSLPCCRCYEKPDPECPCEDHRDENRNVLTPHDGASCALRAHDVRVHPKDPTRFAYPLDARSVDTLAGEKLAEVLPAEKIPDTKGEELADDWAHTIP